MSLKKSQDFKSFANCAISKVRKIADRTVAFLYFRAVTADSGETIKQIIADFVFLGLAKPNITKLRKAMRKDRRVTKFGKDGWRLTTDKVKEVELKFNLSNCLKIKKPDIAVSKNTHTREFIDNKRIKELKNIKNSQFDFSRLIQMTKELNDAFSNGNYLTVIFFVRAIIDHVPPIFGLKNFSEIANNYKSSKSFKELMSNLDIQSRKIADHYLHTQIRKKESLPNKTQVNFSSALDFLLAEIIRIS